MASSARGKRLTEQHRQAQLAIRAAFLRQFIEQWPLLDPQRLDETGPAWVRAVMDQLALYRDESADAAEDYYRAFRLAEAPEKAVETPAPIVARERSGKRKGRGGGLQKVGKGKLVRPTIVWDDDAAETSLIVTGPVNVKAKRKRGKSTERAAREALVEAGGSAARHVLTGGRDVHLEMVRRDPKAIGWIRVTDGDPCAFCAMLSSRGPKYKSFATATTVVNPKAKRALGESYHDHCGCTAEAVYSRSQAWPGRGREFQELWYATTKGLSGKDAINAFRRAHERGIRESERESDVG